MSDHDASKPRPVGRRRAHRRAVEIELIARYLVETLGAGLVGLLAGVDRRTAERWASDHERPPGAGSEQNLRDAYEVFQQLLSVETPATIRAWFMGMNPELDELSPIEAIAAGQGREVQAAARLFANCG